MALNVESIFEHSDEEIDVVSVDPNDERIINFDDILTRSLSMDSKDESDYHTDGESATENLTIDVVNISTISTEINDVETNFSTLQGGSIFVDETVKSHEEPPPKALKRKRQNSDDSDIKTHYKRKRDNANQSNNLWNYFGKSMSELSKAATPILPQTLCTSTKISPISSSKSKKNKMKCTSLVCSNCNLKIKETDKHSKKCPECMANLGFSCNYCNSKFISKHNLLKHILRTHKTTGPVECPICNHTYKTKIEFQGHMSTCCKTKYFACCFCFYASKYRSQIQSHLKSKHKEQFDKTDEIKDFYREIVKNGKVMLKRRGNSTSTNEPLNTISTRTTNPQDYTSYGSVSSQISRYCSKCRKIVGTTGAFAKKQCLVCKSRTLFQCNKCGKQYRSYTTIYDHVNAVCNPKEILRCDHCSFTNPIKSRLRSHIFELHMFTQNTAEALPATPNTSRKQQPPDKLKNIALTCTNCEIRTTALDEKSDKCYKCTMNFAFSCKKCSEQLPNLHEALDHLNKKCELKYYYCNHCEYKNTRKFKLIRHLHTVHMKTERVECPTCHGTFKHQLSLQKHKKICCKPPDLLCCFCPLATNWNWTIRRHLKLMHLDQIGTFEELEDAYRKILRNKKVTLEKAAELSSN